MKDIGCLRQYSTEITEGLHKRLKAAYRRLNRIDAVNQILLTIPQEHGIPMPELNIQACSDDMRCGREIEELGNDRAVKEGTNPGDASGQSECSEGPRLNHKQGAGYEAGTPMDQVASNLMWPQLPEGFYESMTFKGMVLAATVYPTEVVQFLPHYDHGLSMPVQELHSKGRVTQHAWWTAGESSQKSGHTSAHCLWARQRERTYAPNGTLDGRIGCRLEVLFRVRDHVDKVYDVSMFTLLVVCGSRKPDGQEGMIQVD